MKAKNCSKERKWAILSRWIHIIVYAVVGTFAGSQVGYAVEAFATRISRGAAPALAPIAPHLTVIVPLLLLVPLLVYVRPRIEHLRYTVHFPPLPVAVVLAWCGLIGLLVQQPGANYAAVWLYSTIKGTALTIMLSVGIVSAYFWFSRRRRATALINRPHPNIASGLASIPESSIHAWIGNESPIDDRAKDFLSAHEKAAWLWKAIKEPRDGEFQKTVVVQGNFGAGKSTLLKLLERISEKDPESRTIIAWVSCWGFSSLSAQEHTLDCIVDALSHRVDCTALRQMPSAYSNAISSSDTWLQVITHPFVGSSTPIDHLRRIEPILRATNLRLLVIIEDTDRNGPDFDQGHIEAMLNNFRQLKRFSFILTAGERSRIDFPKIAEHIHFSQEIPPDVTVDILNRVRSSCISKYSDIDPTSLSNRIVDLNQTYRAYMRSARLSKESWIVAISRVITTPRLLKTVAASVYASWETLHGEVDLDELIMITAIRHASPALFSFVGASFPELRLLKITQSSDEQQGRVAHLQAKWREIASHERIDIEALACLVSEIHPSALRITGFPNHVLKNRAQGVSSIRGDIYWFRLTAGYVDSGPNCAPKDQLVLREIDRLDKIGLNQEFLDHFGVSNGFFRLMRFFEDYGFRCNDGSFLQAIRGLLNSVRAAPPLGDLYGNCLLCDTVEWIESRIEKIEVKFLESELLLCVPKNLKLYAELYFKFSRHMEKTERERLRKSLFQTLERAFKEADISEIGSYFDATFPFTLFNILFIDGAEFSESLHTVHQCWAWLPPILLSGMEEAPEIFCPQVLFCLFVAEDNPKINIVRLKEFFPTTAKRALTLLATNAKADAGLSANLETKVRSGSAHAKELLQTLDFQ